MHETAPLSALPSRAARALALSFIANFAKFERHVDGSVRDAAPGARVAAE